MYTRRLFALPSLALVACTLLGGCQAPQEPAPAVVTIPTAADFMGPNELLASSGFSHEVRSNLFLQLLREQPDYAEHPPTFAPWLATSYEFSGDRRTLTFHLRPEARWSDGEPITAEDVRFTWEAQTSPEVGWVYSFVKEPITDVEVVDPHTVRFHFARVYANQLLDANEGFILPRHLWSQLPFGEWSGHADWFLEHLAVSGPFTIGSWERQQQLVLEPNPRYYLPGLPRLDRVVFRVVPDESTQLRELESGVVDLVLAVPPASAAEVESPPDLQILKVFSRQYTFLAWNLCRPLFADPRVRRALTQAIDRQAIIDTLWYGRARIATSPILSTVWAHDDAIEPWPYDPQAARRLLAEAGWEDHDGDGILDLGGEPFSFRLTSNSGNRLRQDAAVLIQEQLRRVGIAAEPRMVEIGTLMSMNENHDFDATIAAWAIDTSLDIRYAFHSDEIDDGSNYGCYSNPDADRLMDAIAAAPDPADTRPLFNQLQAVLHRDQPYTFLWEPQRLVGARRRLRDVRPNALLVLYNLQEWWIDEGATAP